MIAHIFQLERHKNIENYAYNFIEFLRFNLTTEEFSRHNFYFSYYEDEDFMESISQRLNQLNLENNIFFYSNHFKMMKKLNREKYDNNIFHQLSSPKVFFYLCFHVKLLKKTSWAIWGGDLYYVLINKLSFKYKMYDYLIKSFVIRNLKFVYGFRGDYDLMQKKYKSKAKHEFFLYPMPSKVYKLNEYKGVTNANKRILVAHSANKANNHEEIFKRLMPFKDKNIEIICPLSYGDLDNTSMIEKRGYELFGSKFKPLHSFMKPDEFSKFLETIDIAIFAVDRQAAVGILTTLISLGKKVYYKRDIVPFEFYEKQKIKIFDTNLISGMQYDEFIEIDRQDSIDNILRINKIYDDKNLIKIWRKIFDS